MAVPKKKRKVRSDRLGPVGIVIFLTLFAIGPVYSVVGSLTWLIVFVVVVFGIVGGINWLLTRYR